MNQTVIKTAVNRIRTQGQTPISPCSIDSLGNIRLCAAAAVASAGLEYFEGFSAAKLFETELAQFQNRDTVRKVYEKLGWNVSDCNEKMTFNDNQKDLIRQSNVINFLENFV